MKHETEDRPLYAENKRAAGMRGGCLPVAVATAAVCALLAAPGIAMAVLGWLTGGAE